MSSSIELGVVVSYAVFSVILLFILLFHMYRMHHKQKWDGKTVKIFKYIQLSHVSYITLTLPTIRCILLTTWHFTPAILNSRSCQIFITIDASIWFAIQGFIHLFMAMRSRLNSLEPATTKNTIWFNIGLVLIISDFASMLYTLSGTAFDVEHVGTTCKPTNISLILIIGTMCSSVFIGLYSLFVFIIPLQKYVQLENEVNPEEPFLRKLILKIIICSSTMTITTLLTTIIIGAFEEYVETVTAIDNIINSYCILMQFRDIDTATIKHQFLQKVVFFLQFSCICISDCRCRKSQSGPITLTQIVALHRKRPTFLDHLPQLDPNKSFTRSFSTKSAGEISITESNYHDDRKKYIETIIQVDINNGVTGEHISLSVAETAYIFWQKNVGHLHSDERLEIACCLFFGLLRSNKDLNDVLTKYLRSEHIKIAALSAKFFDNLEWLLLNLLNDTIDLHGILEHVGKQNKALNVDIIHLDPILHVVHETFAHYFDHKYSFKEQHAIDKIFSVAAQIITGQNIQNVQIITESEESLEFLTSLESCLKSQVGTKYLYRVLEQTFCDEIVIWLQSMKKFKTAMSDKERFMNARRIKNTCIERRAPFSINISHETRSETLRKMTELEKQWRSAPDTLIVSVELFDMCHFEILRLIEGNHWKQLVENINTLQNSSI